MASTTVDKLLDKVMNTKLQRKAKAVIMTCVQFIFTNTVIVLNVAEKAESLNKNVSQGLKITVGISVAYAAGIAIFLLIHSMIKGDSIYQTNLDIEEAYEKTNQTPVFDGILEIPLAIRFKGPVWWLIWIIWALFLIIAALFVALVAFLPDFDVSNATSVAVGAAVFELYEITADFSEYWIYTRHTKKVTAEFEDEMTPDLERDNNGSNAE